jgi:tetratricopeptide (TPR) repeat protein
VTYIKKAIEGDKDPKEDWYRLLLSAHLSLKQNKSASAVLETLIARYPHRKEYWQQLSAIYLQRELEMRALAVRLLADRLDLGDAKTLINLADMYRYLAIPYKSGQLLAKSMDEGVIEANYDHLDKLASSWLAARELDLAAQTFQRMLSLDASGQSHLRLAQVYVALEQWQEAAGVLVDLPAEFKGNDQGKAQMMLGTSYFHLADYNKAKSAFAKALTVESTRTQAAQWLQHIDDVLEKQNDAEAS